MKRELTMTMPKYGELMTSARTYYYYDYKFYWQNGRPLQEFDYCWLNYWLGEALVRRYVKDTGLASIELTSMDKIYARPYRIKICSIEKHIIKFHIWEKTREYRKLKNNKVVLDSVCEMRNYIFSILKSEFVYKGYQNQFEKRFDYQHFSHKTTYTLDDGLHDFLFRCTPVYGTDYEYCKSMYNEKMAKNGLNFASYRRNKDYQLDSDTDDANLIVFSDTKLINDYEDWRFNDRKRRRHKRSWKENTKKRHQYESDK